MVKQVPGPMELRFRACLATTDEFDEGEVSGSELESWLEADVSYRDDVLIVVYAYLSAALNASSLETGFPPALYEPTVNVVLL